MPLCEDYPCCGHGPPPQGDGGGCPHADGSFDCSCGARLPVNSPSALCVRCRNEIGEYDEYYGDRLDRDDRGV